MKIIHVITAIDIGGAETALFKLLSFGNIAKEDVLVVSLTTKGEIGFQLTQKGFQVIALNMKSMFSLPMTFYSLMKLIRANNPDIVQCWLYHADLIGGVVSKISGVKHVVWGVRSTELKSGSYLTSLIRKLCALLSYFIPSKIICVAEAAKAKHVALGYARRKMVVIGNGFDLSVSEIEYESIKLFKQALNIKDHHVVVGSVGRFSTIKGHDIFIEAIKLMIEEYPNLKILMIGRNVDKKNKQLLRWIDKTQNSENFILLGERRDIPLCMAVMDIFCLHSRSEGFPNVLGEAMSAGLSCISTDVGDAAELLGDTGIIVYRNNPEYLARGLKELVSNSKERNKLIGRKAKQRIEKKFSIESTCQKFEAIYRELLANRGEFS